MIRSQMTRAYQVWAWGEPSSYPSRGRDQAFARGTIRDITAQAHHWGIYCEIRAKPGFRRLLWAGRGGFVSDARTGKRFPLELPIKIHKSDQAGEHSGVAGDLSAAGVSTRS